MGPRRSTRLNVVIGGVVPPLRGSTMAQAVPSKLARARAQALHSHASRIEQPAPDKQPTPVAQPAPAEQHAIATQPVPAEQPTSGPVCSRGPTCCRGPVCSCGFPSMTHSVPNEGMLAVT
ncbi:hypothetical protein ACFX14_034717 [Malus domestica]